MTTVLQSIFNFNQNKDKDFQITNKISKIQSLLRDLQKEKHHDLDFKIKNILNAALFEQKQQSLFELVYRNASRQSPVQWVSVLDKTLSLLSSNSTFMNIIIQAQDHKMPIQKCYIPNYLIKNNLLNESSGYQSISNSISGSTVTLIDYVFIRLLHAIFYAPFWEIKIQSNSEYQSDDMYFYMCRNPYLMLLRNYFEYFSSNDKHLKKLVGNVKMFFVDQILLRHRINKSTTYLKDFTFLSDKCKVKPHYLLVIFLLLKKGRVYFEQKNLYFQEIAARFNSLIDQQHEIFFRLFFRSFLFAYSKNSIDNRVIDHLDNANERNGVFYLQRYQAEKFEMSLSGIDKRQKIHFNQSKTMILKLLEKDQNVIYNGKVNFSTMRTLGCFFYLEIAINSYSSNFAMKESVEPLRIGSESASLEIVIQKIYRRSKQFLKKQSLGKISRFTKQNEIKLNAEIKKLGQLYEKAYGKKIDYSKFDDLKQNKFGRDVNIKGNSEDFTLSVQTYKKDIEYNCWSVPLKESEYEILYKLFYGIARSIDNVIPGKKQGQNPRINLRYFSNPFVFMITMLVLLILGKIIF